MLKSKAAAYFKMSKKERRGTIVLLTFITLFTALPFFYPFFIKEKKYDSKLLENEIAALKIKQPDSSNRYKSKQYNEDAFQQYYHDKKNSPRQNFKGALFNFDPNTLDEAGWKKLGVKEKTAQTILKYVSKGGKFYKAEDINKIWGLSEYDKERLLPFVTIDESRFAVKQTTKKAFNTYEKPIAIKALLDVNASDTSELIALPGIGSKLAQRILNFRNKLGGFYSVDQIGETFGLPDSTFQKIKSKLTINIDGVKQLNINTANAAELKAHPYIRYEIANAIIQYRKQHGNFNDTADLKKIMIISDDLFAKISPYVTVK